MEVRTTHTVVDAGGNSDLMSLIFALARHDIKGTKEMSEDELEEIKGTIKDAVDDFANNMFNEGIEFQKKLK